MVKRRPIAIDLFAGAGGLSLGFEMAGFDVVAAVERDPVHCAIHSYNFPTCKTICADITTISGAILRERVPAIKETDIDVIMGGPPCQGFSLIGKRKLDEPRNTLIQEFARIVLELRPKYFVFENVHGITVGAAKNILDAMITDLKKGGYQIVDEYKVLNALDYGVPQDRRRLILLGARKGFALPSYPPATCRPRTAGKINRGKGDLPLGPTVHQALNDLPNADDFDALLETDSVRTKFGRRSDYVRKLNSVVGHFSYPRKIERKLLTSSLRTEHSKLSRRRFRNTVPGTMEPVSRFFRLNSKGVSNTLRAGTGNDRGAFTSPRPIHYSYDRCITVREAARLHSYPDWFRFNPSKWHGMRQVGNSVPPLLARAVASQIVRVLGVKPVKPKLRITLGDEALLAFTLSEAANHFQVDRTIAGTRTKVRRT